MHSEVKWSVPVSGEHGLVAKPAENWTVSFCVPCGEVYW